jgi:hypothetical protein
MVFMIALMAIFLCVAFTVNTQTATNPAPIVSSPIQVDLTNLFTSLTGFAAGVLFFTAIFKKWWNTNGTLTIVLSFAISLILGCIGWLLSIGIFAALVWYYVVIYGIVVTALANGLSTWGIISYILTLLKLKLPEVTPPATTK